MNFRTILFNISGISLQSVHTPFLPHATKFTLPESKDSGSVRKSFNIFILLDFKAIVPDSEKKRIFANIEIVVLLGTIKVNMSMTKNSRLISLFIFIELSVLSIRLPFY